MPRSNAAILPVFCPPSLVGYNVGAMPFTAKRRWFRYSLRTFLLVIALLCVWLGIQVNAARRQRDMVAAILRAFGEVHFDYQMVPGKSGKPGDFVIDRNSPPPGPAWLREFIGEDYFQTAIGVSLANGPLSESDFARLAELRQLLFITSDGAEIVPNGSNHQHLLQDSDLSC